MTEENKEKMNTCVRRINAMPIEELKTMLMAGNCPYESEHLIGVPLGQFHCELCGLMIVAGVKHPQSPNTIWVGDWDTGYMDYNETEGPHE